MIKSIALLFLLGTSSYCWAQTLTVDNQPIKITINEHFNGDISTLQSDPGAEHLIPNVIHQGANFYFNPQVLLPPDYASVIASLKENNYTLTSLKPETTSEQPKLTPAPEEVTTEITTEEITFKPENPLEIPPPPEPIIHDDNTVHISIPPVIPDAPELPPLELPVPIVVEDKPPEIIGEPVLPLPAEPPILDEVTIVEPLPPVPEMPMAPLLPPLDFPEFPVIIEEIHKPKPCIEDVITIKDELVIPKPQKLFGLLTSVLSVFEEKCKFCSILGNKILNGVQEIPLSPPNIVTPISATSKTIVLLPTISELPVIPIPKLPLDIIISESTRGKLAYPTACAHNIIAERIVPNIILSEKSPKHLKLLSVPAALKFPVK